MCVGRLVRASEFEPSCVVVSVCVPSLVWDLESAPDPDGIVASPDD